MQDAKHDKIDYDGVAADIEKVILNMRELQDEKTEWEDEDGGHEEHDLYTTPKQRKEVVEILRKFYYNILETHINNYFATEDAKRIHYE